MRAVFMGTPEFAVPSLRGLINAQEHMVAAVVTRPDAQKGRGHRMAYSPVKEAALANGIPVLQPERAGDEGFIAQLGEYGADVFVVAAYGLLLPEAVLSLPQKYGCINVHGSLLPKLRGAAPIQRAVINGEKTTGITIMHMDRGMDTGDMILKAELEIADDDTAGSLHDKMSELGARALMEALALMERGGATRTPQDNSEATYAPMLKKEHGHIDWNADAGEIVNLVRGLDPWPAAYVYHNSEVLKVWRVRAIDADGEPGLITDIAKDGIVVGAGIGSVVITEVQARGARRMPAADYLRGHGDIRMGMRLG